MPATQRSRYLAPGDKLGKYDLIRQIAVGGMAELYLARTVGIEGFEKLCVVKRILPQYADDKQFVSMFLNEARLAATLHHPNIAQVYDIGQEQGDYFFSMEYVHGEDLGRLASSAAQDGVPISLDAALTLVAGLCAGLHYAHEKAGADGRPLNVVHRDVSPSNVLVSYDGAVKLVDFGIARQSAGVISTSGGLKGKIAYMSPEQCRGRGAGVIDRRSDIFSIGTLLYELTTSQLPFQAPTDFGVLEQIVTGMPTPPSTVVPGYPPALEAIVLRALARDPAERYPTAVALQGDIEDFAHENRLRVSPLVLARLMSGLFPARLEEWADAKSQGAFFVEQHVVRTLIESGKTGEHPPMEGLPAAPQSAPAVPADDDTTGVRAVPEPPGPITTTMGIVEPPAPALPARRKSEPQVRPTPVPNSGGGMMLPTAGPRVAAAVPNMPGAVPIVAPTPASLGSGGIATPHEGTDPNASLLPACVGSLVSSSATPHAGVPLARAAGIGDVTECVRVPQRKRSTTILFVAGVLGVALAAAITVIVLGSGKVQSASADETAEKPVPAQQVTQGAGHPTEKTVAPPKAEQTDKIDKAKQPEKVEEPVTVTTFHEDAHEQLAPEIKVDPDPVKEAPAKAEPPKPPPKKTPPSPPKRPALVKTPPKPPVVKETPKKPKKEEPKKEEPKKEYNSDSPFLPVRPGGKENK